MTTSRDDAIDLVWEVGEIAKVIGRTPRQTFHMLSTGQIPGRKVGGRWCVSRRKLEEFFTKEDAA